MGLAHDFKELAEEMARARGGLSTKEAISPAALPGRSKSAVRQAAS